MKDVLMGFKSHFKEDDEFRSGCKGEGQELSWMAATDILSVLLVITFIHTSLWEC